MLYVVMSAYSYSPLIELQFKLCSHMEIVYYHKNAHILRLGSEHACTSAIFYEIFSSTKALHCKDMPSI